MFVKRKTAWQPTCYIRIASLSLGALTFIPDGHFLNRSLQYSHSPNRTVRAFLLGVFVTKALAVRDETIVGIALLTSITSVVIVVVVRHREWRSRTTVTNRCLLNLVSFTCLYERKNAWNTSMCLYCLCAYFLWCPDKRPSSPRERYP